MKSIVKKIIKQIRIIFDKKRINYNLFINLLGIGIILFSSLYIHFQYRMILFPDSYYYYKGGLVILGLENISNWFSIRGWSFPLIIATWIKLFGNTHTGLLMGTYLFYFAFILCSAYILQSFLKYSSQNRIPYFIVFLIVVVYNSLIIGYNHTLLTEAIMPAIYLLSSIFLFKWFDASFKDSKVKFSIYSTLLALIGVFIWFIKQPYAPAFYAAFFITIFLSFFKKKKKYILIEKSIVFVIGIILLFGTYMLWTNYIQRVVEEPQKTESEYFSSGILGGINVYYNNIKEEEYCNNNYIYSIDISKNTRKKLNQEIKQNPDNWCKNMHVYEIRNLDGTHVKHEINFAKNGKFSAVDNSIFLIINFIKHPSYILRSYFYNYLAILDIQKRDLSRGYVSSGILSNEEEGENLTNGVMTFYDYYGNNNLTKSELFDKFVVDNSNVNMNVRELLITNLDLCFYLFKFLSLLALPVLIYSIIKFVKSKNVLFFIVIVLSIMTFTDQMFHVFMGAIIDRYVYSVYPLMIIACILLTIVNKEKCGKEVSNEE